MAQRRPKFLAAIVGAIVITLLATNPLQAHPARASVPGGAGYMYWNPGFDDCVLPTTTAMQAWWTYSSYFWYATYIGGENVAGPKQGCNPLPSSSWLTTVHAQGWEFDYIWVGLQPPCTSYANRFSPNTTTAFSQGEADAVSAIKTLENLSVGTAGTPLIFDLESAPSSCQAATNSFIQGWVDYLNSAPAQIPGVYGSVCGSNLAKLAALKPTPTFIWGADPDGNSNPSDLWYPPGNCGVSSGLWVDSQRLKQSYEGYNQTVDGYPLHIDVDCADSFTTPSGGGSSGTYACTYP